MYNGKHIVFIGDSFMHYQYLSFVYSLRHCHEVSMFSKPFIAMHNWGNWKEMFLGTSGLLSPHEQCNCFRDDRGFVEGKVFTNRYYHDHSRDVRATYLNFGWNFEYCQGRTQFETRFDSDQSVVWKYSLPDTIANILGNYEHKPDVLLLNAGFFPNQFHDSTYAESVLAAVKYVQGLRLVWKTTNYGLADKTIPRLNNRLLVGGPVNFFEVDSKMCGYSEVQCLNLSWTKLLPAQAWGRWGDGYHFVSFVYSWINRQFMQEIMLSREPIIDLYSTMNSSSYSFYL
jgi:hypothetical protein